MIQELRMQIIILIFFMAISMKEYGFKKMRKMSGDYNHDIFAALKAFSVTFMQSSHYNALKVFV